MKKLSLEKKHLGDYFDNITPLQTHQYLLLWPSKKVHSNIFINKLYSTNGKAYNQA